MSVSGYSEAEIAAIGGWLLDGMTASGIVPLFWERFGRRVSRNAVVGIVHRNKTLRAIGFQRESFGGTRGAKAATPRRKREKTISLPDVPGASPARAASPAAPSPMRSRDKRAAVPARPGPLAAGVEPKTLADLGAHECRWPVNDAAPGETHLFCGAAKGIGPYCAAHAAVAGAGYSAAEALRRWNGFGARQG